MSRREGDGAGPGAGSKAQSVADALNRLLSTLVIRATKAEGVRHYFDIGVIGYGRKVGPAFEGTLAARSLVSVEDIYANPARVEERTRKVPDGAGVEQLATAEGDLRLGDTLVMATDALAQWFLRRHEQGERPWASLPADADFAGFIAEQRAQRRLRNDDIATSWWRAAISDWWTTTACSCPACAATPPTSAATTSSSTPLAANMTMMKASTALQGW